MEDRLKIGIGYDVHRLVAGRDLVLGGVLVPYEKGLLGHSDADVLLHAVCDAILGALGCGDIGRHFPDTDERYRGISSLKLLEKVQALAGERGYGCANVDAIVVAQQPKLAAYRDAMQENIARCLKVDSAVINVKATTTEGLGFEGRGEGISSKAVVLIKKID
ncbi:MAG: 2-C-methyl-D-erythritol 2,4-cyclodiphosphate synthase [Deltaproteobacteria bacterium]|nr:2-C-methyl-D-erythritol 2,4-cyclodiphosphate synthase [Deltaproteobacteria bacterium]